LGEIADFSFPKALQLVVDSLKASNLNLQGLILDYFTGSGTTAHAVISLNRVNSDHNIPTAFTSLETEGGITK
jgi:DNA modification methylase